MNTPNNEAQDSAKPNWPLIFGGAVAAILLSGLAAGVIALYVSNFNLLGWLE